MDNLLKASEPSASNLVEEQIRELKTIDIPCTFSNTFDEFWEDAVKKVATSTLKVTSKTIDYPLDGVEVRDTTFSGLDGTPIKSWVLLPEKSKQAPVPAIVWFHGGNGSRGRPFQYLHWLMAGFAVVAMDFRQQGGHTGSNTSLDRYGASSFIIMNIENYHSFYLYHAWTDGLSSIKLAMETAEIDEKRVFVGGASQGGGTALVMASLNHDIALCLADVPSYCWWDRRIFTRTGGTGIDLAKFIQRYPHKTDIVYETLSYYDAMNHVKNIKCPVLVSCGLKDESVPPECVYAAYNKIMSEKIIQNYPQGGHAIDPWHVEKQLCWVRDKLL